MPILVSTVSPHKGVVGFALPVFRETASGNADLLQILDANGKIVDFHQCELPAGMAERSEATRYVEPGGDGIWAFRSAHGVFVGTEPEIQALGLDLLQSGELDETPFIAAEMARFCRAEERFLSYFQKGFHYLDKNSSPVAANTWRDAEVLLPLIRQDIARYGMKRHRHLLQNIFAMTEKSVTTILVPEEIAGRVEKLPKFESVAHAFGILDYEIQPIAASNDDDRGAGWDLMGVGGFASHAITARSRGGKTQPASPTGKLITRASEATDGAKYTRSSKKLFVGITGSDLDGADCLSSALTEVPNYRYRHVVNVRPVGFGTPSNTKASPRQMLNQFSDIDMVWLLAAHRLRQTGSYTNHMSTMHVISRNIRASIDALTGALSSQQGIAMLESLRNANGIGIIALSRHSDKDDEETIVKRLIYNMLTEDALLHTAQSIQIIWPGSLQSVRNKVRRVELGAHVYAVDFMPAAPSGRSGSLIGLAPNVSSVERTPGEFRDFCVSLFAGYGWRLSDDDPSGLTFSSVRGIITVEPLAHSNDTLRRIEASSTADRHRLLITNKTVTASMRHRAKTTGLQLIHYSELGRWMKSEFNTFLFGNASPD